MTYAEAVARLLALRGGEYAGMRPGLERIEALLDALGRPERGYTLAQVGGTNGKGSISSMLAPSHKSNAASFMYGKSNRLTKNPGPSFITMGDLPSALA